MCLSNVDFARNLRRLADLLEQDDPIYQPKHMMILILDSDATVQRESYGARDFDVLDATGMLAWAQMELYAQTK
jgi:hypothetical protein